MKTKVLENGKEINYLDVVHHTTRTKFGFWDRLRILFGCVIVVKSELYTAHEYCNVLGSEAFANVEPLFKRKSVMMVESPQ